MTIKQQFFEKSYQKAITIIQGISDNIAQDIYALSFWITNEDDDYRFPMLIFGYNTFAHFQEEKGNTEDYLEYKWNFAYWLADEIDRIGGEHDDFLTQWFKQTPYYYTQEQEDQSEDDDEIFDEILSKGKQFQTEFIEIVIEIAKRLFTEKIIEQKFGKDIPIIIHDLEYYDEPIHWTKSANPPELIKEFLVFAKNG